METFMFTDAERQLTTERQVKYQGTAKVDLDQIFFPPSLNREVDPRNVERLCEIFRKDNCRRLDIRNHVTVIVSKRHLRRARRAVGVTTENLMTNHPAEYPHLHFPAGQVQCLHGQHRLKAGEATLPPTEQWWTVDLYLDDISQNLQNALVDEYANEKQPSDGEIYRKIRQYQHEHNARFQKRWWSRLSDNKAKRLRQLTSPDNVDLCAAFDALLAVPGVWNGMSLGSLNKLMALKCDEEIIHYLQHVESYWATLVNHDRAQMAKIDLHTVDMLQLHAPKASKADKKAVKGLILSGEVFSNFSEPERGVIWDNLQSSEACDGVIPSLFTFFRDISYLEVCADAVKRLFVLNKHQHTAQKMLVHSFRPPRAGGDCLIQTSETAFRRQPGTYANRMEFGYRQIWMYTMRHYPEMAKDVQSNNLKAKPTRAKADETAIYDMALLARKLGFRSTQIKKIMKQSPDQQIARAALLKARKPDRYHYDSHVLESLVGRIARYFSLATPNEGQPASELIVGRAVKLKDRCGVPPEQAQQLDCPHCFLDRLHAELPSQRNVSSLYVRQCVYYAFFGKMSTSQQPRTTTRSSSLLSERSLDDLSPLFVPDDNPRLGPELNTENAPRRSIREGQPEDRRQLRETRRERRHQRREERQRRQQERQARREQAAEHVSTTPQEPSLRDSLAGEDSTIRDSTEAIIDVRESMGSSLSEDLQLRSEAEGSEQGLEGEVSEGTAVEIAEQEQLQRKTGAWGAAERADQEQLARETAEQTEQEQAEQEPAEQEPAEQEPAEQEPAEQEPAEQEPAEQEPAEQEQIAVESQEQAGKEPVEKEQLAREAERRAAMESAEQERFQREAEERTTVERAEQERLKTEALERAEQEQPAREADERASAEHASQFEDGQVEQEQRKAHDGEVTAAELDELLTEMLQADAEQRALGNQDTQGHTQLREGPSDIAGNAQQEDERVGRERATALDRLQNTTENIPPETNNAPAQPSRPVTQLDLPSLIARWRERASQLDSDNPQQSRSSRQRNSQQQRHAKPAGLRKSRMKARPTHQVINRAGTRDAAINDHLGWDLEDGGPGFVSDIRVSSPVANSPATQATGESQSEVRSEVREMHESAREESEPEAPVLVPEESSDRVLADVNPVAGPLDQNMLPDTVQGLLEGTATADVIPTPSRTMAAALNHQTLENNTSQRRQRRLSRPLGTKKTRNKPKQERPEGTVLSDIETAHLKEDPLHGPVTRENRAPKVVTQIDFTGLIESVTEGPRQEPDSGRQEWPMPPMSGHEAMIASLPDGDAESRPKRVRQHGTIRDETATRAQPPQIVGEVTVPPLPAALRRTPQPGAVMIIFRAYERGQWHVTDRVHVDPSDPSEAQRVAYKYAREENQNARFYNRALRKVSVVQCVRAAIGDGTNTILMSLGRDLVVTRARVAEVARILEANAGKQNTTEDDSDCIS